MNKDAVVKSVGKDWIEIVLPDGKHLCILKSEVIYYGITEINPQTPEKAFKVFYRTGAAFAVKKEDAEIALVYHDFQQCMKNKEV